MSCVKLGSLHLMHAGSSFIYSICISNQDTHTSREPEHPEKKTPTRPMHLCRSRERIMQRRCQRPWSVTEREKDVSDVGALSPSSHQYGSQDVCVAKELCHSLQNFMEPVSFTSKSSVKCEYRIYDRSRWTRHPIENADDMDFDEEENYRDGSLSGGKRLQSTPKVSVEST